MLQKLMKNEYASRKMWQNFAVVVWQSHSLAVRLKYVQIANGAKNTPLHVLGVK